MFRGHRPMANNSRLHTTLGVLTPFAFVLISRKYPLLSFLPNDKCSTEKFTFPYALSFQHLCCSQQIGIKYQTG